MSGCTFYYISFSYGEQFVNKLWNLHFVIINIKLILTISFLQRKINCLTQATSEIKNFVINMALCDKYEVKVHSASF